MRFLSVLLGVLLMTATTAPASARQGEETEPQWRLVIHGGAGVIERSRMTPAEDEAIRAALNRALDAGSAILARGGSSLDAVEATVRVLEDDPHFNAGRGSVFTYDGRIEMDASIMDGRNRNAGAVTGVTATRNPIGLARRVMEQSPHVFLSREGADQFSREQGLPQEPPEYFQTPERRRHLHRRPDRQALGPDRRFADCRCRHLCRRPGLRRLRDGRRGIFHPRRRRP